MKAKGYNYKYDLSLPLSDYYKIVEETRERISSSNKPDLKIANWGHLADGNLHMNIYTPGLFDVDHEVEDFLVPYIFESVAKRGGSISAEHGLGQDKNKYLGKYAKSDAVLSVMRSLKRSFDPNGIMNPGKFLPLE